LKSLGCDNSSRDSGNIVLNIGGEICYDSIVNHINEFFITIAKKLVSNLPTVRPNFGLETGKVKEFYLEKGITDPGSFVLKCIDSDFVLKELRALNVSKSTGLDGISPLFLRDGAEILSKPITHVINCSIETQSVPDDMKLAWVSPIYKKRANWRLVITGQSVC